MKDFFYQNESIELNELQLGYLSKLEGDIFSKRLKLIERDKCYQCNHDKFDSLAKHDRHGLKVESLLCRQCGLISTSPIFNQDSLEVFYDEFYVPINYGVEKPEHLYNKDQCRNIFLFLDEVLDEKLSLIDVGCGTGDLLKYFKENLSDRFPAMKMRGCEYNSALTKEINRQLKEELVFHGGIDQAFPEEKFDLIILSHVFEHIVDPRIYLKKLKQRLKKNSYLYIEVPSLFGHFQNYHNYKLELQKFFTIAHIFNFTNVTLRNLLESEGFRVIKSDSHVRMLVQYSGEYNTDFTSDYFPTKFYVDNTLPKLRRINEEDNFVALQERVLPYYQAIQIEKLSEQKKKRIELKREVDSANKKNQILKDKIYHHRRDIRFGNLIRKILRILKIG